MADELCYFATSRSRNKNPLLVLSLPTTPDHDFDELLDHGLDLIDKQAELPTIGDSTILNYELLIFCAGKNRPTWPWLLQNFSKLDQRYKKGLQKLYLVHEKSWIRVCMQLLENVVSPKFARKVKHITTLEQLSKLLGETMSFVRIPKEVQEYDDMLRHEEQRSTERRQRLRESTKGNLLALGPRQTEKKNVAKRKLSPPLAPPSRNARSQQTSLKAQGPVSAPPTVPPRRTQKTTRNISSESLIIFEDAEDEEAAGAAAEEAEQHLEQILLNASNVTRKMDTFSTPGKRSSSAPSGKDTGRPSTTNKAASSIAADRPQNTLRRAISGPVTPSSTLRQFVPTRLEGDFTGPPKLMIGGRAKTIRTVDSRGGKVGGLKALFEEKALVAQSMSTVV